MRILDKTLSRRDALAGLVGISGLVLPARSAETAALAQAETKQPMRVAALDWGIAATLTAMGSPPIAVPAPKWCNLYFGRDILPREVVDVGLLFTPNFEALQELSPDLIVTPSGLSGNRGLLQSIASVVEINLFQPGSKPLELAMEGSQNLATAIGRPAEGRALCDDTLDAIAIAKTKLASSSDLPIVLASPIDDRHVSIFGQGSLMVDVLRALGLESPVATSANTEFQIVGIDTLHQYGDAAVVLIGTPSAPELTQTLSESRLWNTLPFAQAGRVYQIGPVLGSGGLPAAARFARLLTEAIKPHG